jgi:hypothetical protein
LLVFFLSSLCVLNSMLFVSELSIHDFLTEGYLIYFVQCYFFLSDHERNSSYNNFKKNSDMYYQYFMHIFSINDKLHL